MRETELLIPAGSLDVLKTAVVYGADAVYIERRGLWPQSQSAQFFQRRNERGNCLCP